MSNRNILTTSSRWVIKIGTSLLTDPRAGLNTAAIASLVAQIAALKQQGVEVLLVSSGAIVEGIKRLGLPTRPTDLAQLQAAAAVGQMGLMRAYETAFAEFAITTAQVLLTHADLANRERYLNARNTLRRLLALAVLPIINENDAVVNDEIRFGDNDTLAALAGNLVEAEVLVILTDCAGVYNRDPRRYSDAELITEGRADDVHLLRGAGAAGAHGRGGMHTKILAAQQAARNNAATVIADGRARDILAHIRAGNPVGTLLTPGDYALPARKQWLAGQLRGSGAVVLDDGAVQALRGAGVSVLPIGVTAIQGTFGRGALVTCVDARGNEIARGLSNYSSVDAARIAGKPSDQIATILGYGGEAELIHRDNIALTA